MKTTLSLFAAVLVLASLPSCSAPAESTGDEADEHVATTSQALCLAGIRPTPVAYVPGFQNPITSGTYEYGNGACDGYAVQFTSLTPSRGYMIEVHVGDAPNKAACERTSMTVWVWHRRDGGSWTYAGTTTDNAWWYEYAQACLHLMKFEEPGPMGTYEVLVKGQARTGYIPGLMTFPYNRPVRLTAHSG
ncbi:MAG: hypothetical protein JST00_16395 [Deltaproteobacteria bacterium]|nr:hypothetical protein [Deltaproteobacteria bacterium]